jgi:hypothetical protein
MDLMMLSGACSVARLRITPRPAGGFASPASPSLWLDLAMLWQTIRAVVRHHGAY